MHNPDMPSLSSRLIEARKVKGWSQQRLADKAGVSQSLVGNLEAMKQMGSTKLTKIADVLGVSPLWLAEGKGSRHSTSAPTTQATRINVDFLWRCHQAVDAWACSCALRPAAKNRLQNAVLLYEVFSASPQTTDEQMHLLLERLAQHVESRTEREQRV